MNLSAQDETDVQQSIRKILSNFLVSTLPNEVEKFVRPYVPERIQNQFYDTSDLRNFDLYCNLRVFIRNDKFFLDSRIIVDYTIFNCAKIILNWRNKIAHRSPKSELLESYEQTFFELMAINRFFSLLPIEDENNDEIEKIKKETINLSYEISKNYFEIEKKLVDQSINDKNLDSNTDETQLEVENIKYDEDEDDKLYLNEPKITRAEALQLLRKLRQEIIDEYPDIPKFRNILRDSILDNFIDNKIINFEKFKEVMPKSQFLKTDPKQFIFFDKINEIVNRI